ncbi:uncharacterized protein LOC121774130 [Salvia splendens]|uniref:uncharacterized protein LOC121774130 n=1 Tax=Salvia splendens TaxID=180675 RepID=UPI001C27A2C9|nr:uncharacterized protein LOC121774130 [Salvia splendens]
MVFARVTLQKLKTTSELNFPNWTSRDSYISCPRLRPGRKTTPAFEAYSQGEVLVSMLMVITKLTSTTTSGNKSCMLIRTPKECATNRGCSGKIGKVFLVRTVQRVWGARTLRWQLPPYRQTGPVAVNAMKMTTILPSRISYLIRVPKGSRGWRINIAAQHTLNIWSLTPNLAPKNERLLLLMMR